MRIHPMVVLLKSTSVCLYIYTLPHTPLWPSPAPSDRCILVFLGVFFLLSYCFCCVYLLIRLLSGVKIAGKCGNFATVCPFCKSDAQIPHPYKVLQNRVHPMQSVTRSSRGTKQEQTAEQKVKTSEKLCKGCYRRESVFRVVWYGKTKFLKRSQQFMFCSHSRTLREHSRAHTRTRIHTRVPAHMRTHARTRAHPDARRRRRTHTRHARARFPFLGEIGFSWCLVLKQRKNKKESFKNNNL